MGLYCGFFSGGLFPLLPSKSPLFFFLHCNAPYIVCMHTYLPAYITVKEEEEEEEDDDDEEETAVVIEHSASPPASVR